jgi:uncharacterized membrane protein
MGRSTDLSKNFASLLRRHFLTGVFVLIPFLAVAWIIGKFFSALWTLHLLIPEEWKPIYHFDPFVAQILNFGVTLGLTILFAFFVSVLGWFSKNIVGARILGFLSRLVQRIPIVRAVFSSLSQLLKTMDSGEKQQFSRVVYLEYPRKGTWALAFVTSTAKAPTGEKATDKFINVYVPTTPNPTSGFHLIVPESEVRNSGMSVEDAFKTILSLGIASGDSSKR